MAPFKGDKFYFKNGRLDLSGLDESMQINRNDINQGEITDQELVELQNNYAATTLEEMALIFETDEELLEKEKEPSRLFIEIEEEFIKAFNDERINEEMKEFKIKK